MDPGSGSKKTIKLETGARGVNKGRVASSLTHAKRSIH